MILLLSALLCLVTVAYIAAPFWFKGTVAQVVPGVRRASRAEVVQAEARESLLEQRDHLLRELKDLEFDRAMGKIDPSDYDQLRASTASAAAAVLEKLEPAAPSPTSGVGGAVRKKRGKNVRVAAENGHNEAAPRQMQRAEAEAEAEILIARARRKFAAEAATEGVSDAPDAVLEPVLEETGWRCKSCGRDMAESDRFCASCGSSRE